jgi:hypothetical protein
MMTQAEIKAARERLCDPDYGFVTIPNMLSLAEADRYREECDAFISTGPVYHARVNTDTMPDYVHPRSHDEMERAWRIYQFLHNKRSAETDEFLRSTLRFRDELESPWTVDPEYLHEKETLQNYVIVTKYAPDAGMLPKHKDYDGNVKSPLLQFLILLSEPDVDYREGEFILYTRSGRRLRLHQDLDVHKGDALLFDKSLYHEVEGTRSVPGNEVGRWTVLIGARAQRENWFRAYTKLWMNQSTLMRVFAPFRARKKNSARRTRAVR